MKLSLERRLKKKAHVDVARLQDELVSVAYELDNNAVLHGGTAIWRCYGGKRFSEDIDLYAGAAGKWDEISQTISARGLEASKLKKTGNLLYAKVVNAGVEVRLEVNFAVRKKGVLADYEKADGSFLQVLTLPPEELFLEKIAAYSNRRFARDLYDLAHLSPLVDEKIVCKEAKKFVANIAKPVDVENLKAIVYEGNIPSFEQLRGALEGRWQ